MILQIVLGGIAAYAGFYGHSQFSPVLFVEGMILLNNGLLQIGKHKSLMYK